MDLRCLQTELFLFWRLRCKPIIYWWTLPLPNVGRVILSFQGCRVYFIAFILFLMEILLANNVDPDQMPHNVASDLGLHCLPMTF